MARRAQSPRQTRQQATAPARRRLILLADDSQLTCELFGEYLTHRGYEVVFAYDGESAITVAGERKPDVIVMDVSMPRLNGVAALRRLKEEPRTQHIPVIVLTGRVLRDYEDAARAAGATSFLVKPCLPDEIESAIERVLKTAS